MRKVTQQVVNAFLNHTPKTVGNTSTDGEWLTLHGNLIAKHDNGGIYISNAGWSTNTTKERLNGVLRELGYGYIFQKDWTWYLRNDRENVTLPMPHNRFVRIA